MMEPLVVFALLVAAGCAVWAFRAQRASDRAEIESRAALATLTERTAAQEKAIAELGAETKRLADESHALRERLQEESNARAAAQQESMRIPSLVAEVADLQQTVTALTATRAELQTALEKEREAAAEKIALLQQAQAHLTDAFRALSAEALHTNNDAFLTLAKETLATFQDGAKGDLEQRQQAIGHLVDPIKLALDRIDVQVADVEKQRVGSYAALSQQVQGLQTAQAQWRQQAEGLTRALTAPRAVGQWGEIQLKRVVELAGMKAHCDFVEQETIGADRSLRPDLIVRYPNGKQMVVDAKAPMSAYLAACEATDETARSAHLAKHASLVREHLKKLGGRAYWDALLKTAQTPEFVILFLPAESLFSAALLEDPTLIEQGVADRVLLATPVTLIALLKAVSYGWQQQQATENAEEIRKAGRELYERLVTLLGHIGRVGTGLNQASERYNEAVGSLEQRLLPSARRMRELGAGADKEIAPLPRVDTMPRLPQMSEPPPPASSPPTV